MNTLSPKFINKILHRDCVACMKELSDGSIPLTVTSPPYDNIRKYGGHPFDFEAIAKELWRITTQGGVVVWVVADQVNAKGSLTGTKHKQALRFMGLGFTLRNELTLTTVSTRLPQKTRYAQSSHTGFVLSKGHPRVVNLLRDKPNKSAGQFKKDWAARSEDGTMRRGHYGKHIPSFGLRSDVWTYQVGGGHTTRDEISHPDPMAEKMAEDLILSFSRPGDVVFDPMAGSGTSLKMALLNHRSYLGMEVHKPYWKEAVERLAEVEEQYKKRLDDELNPKIVVPNRNGDLKMPSIVLPHGNGDAPKMPSAVGLKRNFASLNGVDRFEKKGSKRDVYYTPDNAISLLLPFLPANKVIWEFAWGQGHIAHYLQLHGYKVVGGPDVDFLTEYVEANLLVSNPPFSKKDEFLRRAYSLGKPFAMLLPADALVGLARYPLFAKHGIQLLIPNKRINFVGSGNTSPNFNTFWLCWHLLPQNIVFAELPPNGKGGAQ